MTTKKTSYTKQSLATLDEITQTSLTLGSLIGSIRQSEGMTQIEMARQLNMSRQQLCDIEHNRKNVSPKLADQYADKSGYSQEQFARLALQNQVNQAGLDFVVEVTC